MNKQNLGSARRIAPILMALVIGATPSVGQTSTATSTIAVSATVLSFCTIVASALPFGNYSAAVINATTTVNVTCTNGSAYNVGLDAGLGTGATVAARKMAFLTNTLTYGLYQDSGHATVWGNTIGTNTVTGTGNGASQTLTVYGQIPAAQYASPGAYLDTVTATITY